MARPVAALEDELPRSAERDARRPLVIVGNGPAGKRAARELFERMPEARVVIYGDEPWEPYNRVRLSSWLAGEVDWEGLSEPLDVAAGQAVEQRIGYRVTQIDVAARTVADNTGAVQPYEKLILATGSVPFVPNVEGVDLPGVFTFRDLEDTNQLLARTARSHRTVVLGGGLLGLEAARGMQRHGTRVTVIEHADRLLGQQLDEKASNVLLVKLRALGIDAIVGDGVQQVLGSVRVAGVKLRSGRSLDCDTLVIATGIRPHIDLARATGLAFGRGIKVDDAMRTSVPGIYAIGECAEHRGLVYGLVAPALEQAAVAAADIAGVRGSYTGSVAASRLKVVGTHVFSMGPMGAGEDPHFGRAHLYRRLPDGVYRKLLVHRHRLVGAIGVGEWSDTVRLQMAVARRQPVWPWQILRFRRTGSLWPAEDSQGVAQWPAAAKVCQCTGVSRGRISEAIGFGACSVEAVGRATGAGSVCGSCRPLVQDLLGSATPATPAPFSRTLAVSAVLSLLLALAIVFAPVVPYARTVQVEIAWDQLWRNGLLKQISGFSILGLFAVGLLVSLRKRLGALQKLGGFDSWRLVHVLLGLLVLLGLVVHTGLRLGDGLNALLMGSFIVMLGLGGVSTGVIAFEHRIGGALAQRLRRRTLCLHILTFWLVPVLLGFHILKSYWY